MPYPIWALFCCFGLFRYLCEMNWNKLVVRSISGLVYICIILGSIFLGETAVGCMVSVFAALATLEFAKISKDFRSSYIPAVAVDVTGCVVMVLSALYHQLVFLWLLCFIVRLIMGLYLRSHNPFNELAHSLMSQLYIGMPLTLMTLMVSLSGSSMILLPIFLFIWINDTGAFLVGSLFGRHRLFERISPKKSWEGFWGGLVINIVAALLIWGFCLDYFIGDIPLKYSAIKIGCSLWFWVGLAVTVTCFATWGDLVESMIKRNLNIKDSGQMIPGHGGILDRIDSMLLVMPASLLFFVFTGYIL